VYGYRIGHHKVPTKPTIMNVPKHDFVRPFKNCCLVNGGWYQLNIFAIAHGAQHLIPF
jgi:hypothetical protein